MHPHRGVLLLVDGDAGRAERLANRLANLGYDVRIADNGARALLVAHETHPEVIISATELPILDGFRMLEALRSDPRTHRIPVILIPEDASPEKVARGWTAGADLCIPRNQGEADVLATLYRALSGLRTHDRGAKAVAIA